MIAIPNMDKPKECEECPFFMLDGVITDDNEWISYSVCDLLGKTIGDADMLNDCPLTEIVRCGECTHHDDGLCHRPKWSFAVEPMDFCSYGERRTNGNN